MKTLRNNAGREQSSDFDCLRGHDLEMGQDENGAVLQGTLVRIFRLLMSTFDSDVEEAPMTAVERELLVMPLTTDDI
jgi:hypothetical protein